MTDNEIRFKQLTEKLRRHGCRMTPQRLALIRVIAASDGHPNAADLFASVKAEHPTMSLGTVYKTLDLLKDLNEIVEINLNNVSHYDGNRPDSHPHIICTNCGKIIDGDMHLGMAKLVREVERDLNFKIQRHQLNFYGLCSECQEIQAFDEVERR